MCQMHIEQMNVNKHKLHYSHVHYTLASDFSCRYYSPLFETQGVCGNKKVIRLESFSLGGG